MDEKQKGQAFVGEISPKLSGGTQHVLRATVAYSVPLAVTLDDDDPERSSDELARLMEKKMRAGHRFARKRGQEVANIMNAPIEVNVHWDRDLDMPDWRELNECEFTVEPEISEGPMGIQQILDDVGEQLATGGDPEEVLASLPRCCGTCRRWRRREDWNEAISHDPERDGCVGQCRAHAPVGGEGYRWPLAYELEECGEYMLPIFKSKAEGVAKRTVASRPCGCIREVHNAWPEGGDADRVFLFGTGDQLSASKSCKRCHGTGLTRA